MFLFFGITELLSAATAYSPMYLLVGVITIRYDGYGIYCKRREIPNRLEEKQRKEE